MRGQNHGQENRKEADVRRRISRKDLIFIAVLAAVLSGILAFCQLRPDAEAAVAEVTVDGEFYGSWPLSDDREIPVVIDGRTTNIFVIRDGKADMVEADCPDQLCVHQQAISKNRETIVCLPNRVVVQVTGGGESGYDSIAK